MTNLRFCEAQIHGLDEKEQLDTVLKDLRTAEDLKEEEELREDR